MKLYHVDAQQILVDALEMAEDRRARSRGLIGHAPLEAGQGMLIRPCRWIHTFRMSFPIDVIYVDRDWRVVACSEDLVPSRFGRPVLRAQFVVELPAGAIRRAGVQPGDRLELRP